MLAADLKEYLETVPDDMEILVAPVIQMPIHKKPNEDPEEGAVVSPFQMYKAVTAVQVGRVPNRELYFVLGFDSGTVLNVNEREDVGSVH